jgi:putative Mn2+ efflux pump MntP
VTASAAISVGTIAVIMVILGDNLTLQVANENTIIASGIIGIAIGIIGLISYFHSPTKSTKTIKRILVRAKLIEA